MRRSRHNYSSMQIPLLLRYNNSKKKDIAVIEKKQYLMHIVRGRVPIQLCIVPACLFYAQNFPLSGSLCCIVVLKAIDPNHNLNKTNKSLQTLYFSYSACFIAVKRYKRNTSLLFAYARFFSLFHSWDATKADMVCTQNAYLQNCRLVLGAADLFLLLLGAKKRRFFILYSSWSL